MLWSIVLVSVWPYMLVVTGSGPPESPAHGTRTKTARWSLGDSGEGGSAVEMAKLASGGACGGATAGVGGVGLAEPARKDSLAVPDRLAVLARQILRGCWGVTAVVW